MSNYVSNTQSYKSNKYFYYDKHANNCLLRIYPGLSRLTIVGKADDICKYIDWQIAFRKTNR